MFNSDGEFPFHSKIISHADKFFWFSLIFFFVLFCCLVVVFWNVFLFFLFVVWGLPTRFVFSIWCVRRVGFEQTLRSHRIHEFKENNLFFKVNYQQNIEICSFVLRLDKSIGKYLLLSIFNAFCIAGRMSVLGYNNSIAEQSPYV
jgi:hypothetical protein